jgi:hypothetical protein
MAGDMLRAIGEISGLDRLEEQVPEILSFKEGDVIVPPEKQAAALSQLFGFLEEHAAGTEDEALEPGGADPATGSGEPEREVEPVSEIEPEPEPRIEPQREIESQR